MKRKRNIDVTANRERPFRKRIELLNECLSLCLKFNVTFYRPQADLSWYRYAENNLDDNKIVTLIQIMNNAIESDTCLTLQEAICGI
jgi:hypothetical protein